MVMLSTVVIDVVNVVTICQKEKFGQIIEKTNTIIIQTVFSKSQQLVWESKWIDYRDKYGFEYGLFKHHTKIILCNLLGAAHKLIIPEETEPLHLICWKCTFVLRILLLD